MQAALPEARSCYHQSREGLYISICSFSLRKVYIHVVLNIFIKFLYKQVGGLVEAVIQAHTTVPGPDNAGRGQKPGVVATR